MHGRPVGGGWLVSRLTGSLALVFATLGLALVVYGGSVGMAVASGAWFWRDRSTPMEAAPSARALKPRRGGDTRGAPS